MIYLDKLELSVRVINQSNLITQVPLNDFFHPFGKRAWIPDRCTFLNTRCKCNRICSALYKFPCTKDSPFRWTSTTIAKADKLNFLVNPFESAFVFPNHLKISRPRTVIFCLHASYNS